MVLESVIREMDDGVVRANLVRSFHIATVTWLDSG